MASPVDISNYSPPDVALGVGTLSSQYAYFNFVDFFERPVCEHFYADRDVQMQLKEKHFDMLLSDALHQLNRRVHNRYESKEF